MGEYTKSLQLYKADVVENANDTFNIETMLNDNWDKIDEKLEKLPIQNGGLYINSETTEEDKAEAVEAIKEIGLSASDVGAAAQEYVWAVEEKVENKLPLDGSRAMSGAINFAANGADFNTDSWFAIGPINESISLISRKNGKNRILCFNNVTDSLTDALRLWYYDDGNEHTARIFGEHNTSLLATTIQNLISGGSISMVKSVQRGIITIAANNTVGAATISSVNTSKAVVLYGGSINNGSDSRSMSSSGYWDVRLILKSATQVEATRRHAADFDVYVPYQVLEFA